MWEYKSSVTKKMKFVGKWTKVWKIVLRGLRSSLTSLAAGFNLRLYMVEGEH